MSDNSRHGVSVRPNNVSKDIMNGDEVARESKDSDEEFWEDLQEGVAPKVKSVVCKLPRRKWTTTWPLTTHIVHGVSFV